MTNAPTPTPEPAPTESDWPVGARVEYVGGTSPEPGSVVGISPYGRYVYVAFDEQPEPARACLPATLRRVPKSYDLDDFAHIPAAPDDGAARPARPDLNAPAVVHDDRPRTLEEAKVAADASPGPDREAIRDVLIEYDAGDLTQDAAIDLILAARRA